MDRYLFLQLRSQLQADCIRPVIVWFAIRPVNTPPLAAFSHTVPSGLTCTSKEPPPHLLVAWPFAIVSGAGAENSAAGGS